MTIQPKGLVFNKPEYENTTELAQEIAFEWMTTNGDTATQWNPYRKLDTEEITARIIYHQRRNADPAEFFTDQCWMYKQFDGMSVQDPGEKVSETLEEATGVTFSDLKWAFEWFILTRPDLTAPKEEE